MTLLHLSTYLLLESGYNLRSEASNGGIAAVARRVQHISCSSAWQTTGTSSDLENDQTKLSTDVYMAVVVTKAVITDVTVLDRAVHDTDHKQQMNMWLFSEEAQTSTN